MNKLINRSANEPKRIVGVYSARKAAEFLELSDNTFSKGMAGGHIIPQALIEGDSRNSFGFEKAYLAEVKQALPKDLAKGQSIFTPEIITKLKQIKERWKQKA